MAKSNKSTIKHYLVCIGASAGGLQAVTELLNALPNEILPHISLILAQHLSPTYKSRLSELLSRETKLNVKEHEDRQLIKPGNMYICPPDREIVIHEDSLLSSKSPIGVGPKPSIDNFFSSIPAIWGNRTIGIILSGTGSDGSRGVEDLCDKGGKIFVQSPESAKYDGMPAASIKTNLVDFIGSPTDIALEIQRVVSPGKPFESDKIIASKEQTGYLQKILGLLSNRTGTEFSHYKTNTIQRRLAKRLNSLNINTPEEYYQYCLSHTNEIDNLFENVLIGVTEFFRDLPVFEHLEEIIAKRLKNKNSGEQFRIWTSGCATGEEAYTIGMILTKINEKKKVPVKFQIFATDIDERALQKAREGIYASDKLEKVPTEYQRFFTPRSDNRYQINKEIRSRILFSKHDLTTNPPFLKLDLISCRNLLIYFDLELQNHILPIFHYSLNPAGILLLGKSETLGAFNNYFSTLDSKWKIFSKMNMVGSDGYNLQKLQPFRKPPGNHRSKIIAQKSSYLDLIKESLYKQSPNPRILINADMDILEITGEINKFLRIKPGHMSSNIIQLCVDDLQIELRSAINNAIKEENLQHSRFVPYKTKEEDLLVRIIAWPIIDQQLQYELTILVEFEAIQYDEIGIKPILGNKSSDTENARILDLEHQLRNTREDLQSYVEELETANEELQSLNEELQSSNEELQSTNEELETSNEELQSTNEEVQIAYSELAELNKSLTLKENSLLDSQRQLQALLENTRHAFMLLDGSGIILAFNHAALDTFKELFDKILQSGNHINDYLSGDTLDQFHHDYQQTLKGELISKDWSIVNRDKERVYYTTNLHPVQNGANEVVEVVFTMVDTTDQTRYAAEISKYQQLVEGIYGVLSSGIIVTDDKLKIVEVNDTLASWLGYDKKALIGNHLHMIVSQSTRNKTTNLSENLNPKNAKIENAIIEIVSSTGEMITIRSISTLLDLNDSRLIVHSLEDISVISKQFEELSQSKKQLESIAWDLQERIKEKTAILEIQKLFRKEESSNKLFKKALKIIAAGFTEPKLLNVTIQYKDQTYPLTDTVSRRKGLSASIFFKNQKIGDIKVVYIAKKNNEYPSFLLEERELLESIAETISRSLEIKQLYEDLQEKEYFLHAIFDSVTDGISVIDQQGKHLLVNKAMMMMTGYTENELLHSQIPHLYWPEEELTTITEALNRTVKANTHVDHELIFKRKNGERFPVWLSTALITNTKSKEKQYIGIVKDITMFKQQQRILQESENRYRRIFNNSLEMISEHDTGGSIIHVSPGCFNLLGYHPDELLGKSPLEFTHPEDIERIKQEGIEPVFNGESAHVQYRAKHTNGHYVWLETNNTAILDENGEIIGIQSSSRDITASKTYQTSLRNREIMLTKAQEAAQLGVWIFSPEIKNFTYSSKETQKIYEVPNDHLLTVEWVAQHMSDDDNAIMSVHMNAMLDKEPKPFFHVHRLNFGDHHKWVSVQGIPDYDENGNFKQYFGTTLDITFTKLQEEKLNKLVDALKASNEELTQFAYVASHDLQEPLRMISSFTQLLQHKLGNQLDDDGNKYMNFVLDGAERLHLLINDLLKYSRVNTQELIFENTPLELPANNAIKLLDARIQENKAIITIEPLPTLPIVPSMIERVFTNLISNAIKYRNEADPHIHISAIDLGDYWQINVKDNGLGIEKEYFDKIFIIFQRLHARDEYSGTGLGLAICKRIINKHHGEIYLTSEPGQGSTFYFTLPKEPKID